MKENALSCAGLRDLWLTFLPAWLRNFVAACGLSHSTAAYGGLRRRLWGLTPAHTPMLTAEALDGADIDADIFARTAVHNYVIESEH